MLQPHELARSASYKVLVLFVNVDASPSLKTTQSPAVSHLLHMLHAIMLPLNLATLVQLQVAHQILNSADWYSCPVCPY